MISKQGAGRVGSLRAVDAQKTGATRPGSLRALFNVRSAFTVASVTKRSFRETGTTASRGRIVNWRETIRSRISRAIRTGYDLGRAFVAILAAVPILSMARLLRTLPVVPDSGAQHGGNISAPDLVRG